MDEKELLKYVNLKDFDELLIAIDSAGEKLEDFNPQQISLLKSILQEIKYLAQVIALLETVSHQSEFERYRFRKENSALFDDFTPQCDAIRARVRKEKLLFNTGKLANVIANELERIEILEQNLEELKKKFGHKDPRVITNKGA